MHILSDHFQAHWFTYDITGAHLVILVHNRSYHFTSSWFTSRVMGAHLFLSVRSHILRCTSSFFGSHLVLSVHSWRNQFTSGHTGRQPVSPVHTRVESAERREVVFVHVVDRRELEAPGTHQLFKVSVFFFFSEKINSYEYFTTHPNECYKPILSALWLGIKVHQTLHLQLLRLRGY